MDIDRIPFGTDFRHHIQDALRDADVLLAVIGPTWLGKTADGKQPHHRRSRSGQGRDRGRAQAGPHRDPGAGRQRDHARRRRPAREHPRLRLYQRRADRRRPRLPPAHGAADALDRRHRRHRQGGDGGGAGARLSGCAEDITWSARRLAAVVGSLAVVLGGAIIAINLSSERMAQKQVAQQPQPPGKQQRPCRRQRQPPPPPRRAGSAGRPLRHRRPVHRRARNGPPVVAQPKPLPMPADDLSRARERLRRLPESAQRPGGQISDRHPGPRRRDRHRARRVSRGGRQYAAVVPGDVARPCPAGSRAAASSTKRPAHRRPIRHREAAQPPPPLRARPRRLRRLLDDRRRPLVEPIDQRMDLLAGHRLVEVQILRFSRLRR